MLKKQCDNIPHHHLPCNPAINSTSPHLKLHPFHQIEIFVATARSNLSATERETYFPNERIGFAQMAPNELIK